MELEVFSKNKGSRSPQLQLVWVIWSGSDVLEAGICLSKQDDVGNGALCYE
jgi:hypothetical protein